jgi:pimeloyl-ACP methyl ester carboxylesterase
VGRLGEHAATRGPAAERRARAAIPRAALRRRARLGGHAAGGCGRAGTGKLARGFLSLADASARVAFPHTLRAVIDPGGQRVSGSDRLYLAESLPTLPVWGARDPIIPAAHGVAAHESMPGSRLELFSGGGHFPHFDDPVRFVVLLRDFVAGTAPARRRRCSLRLRWSGSRRGTARATTRRSG